jgi:hypothetical protein
MMVNQPLDSLPLWVVFLLTVLVLLAALEAGYWLTKYLQGKKPAKSDGGVGAIAAATLALLAFLLAFEVSFGFSIFNERRLSVIKEANAIGTTYLRAGYLDEPYRTESRELLREYVDIRLAALERANLEMAGIRSEQIHNELWQRAEVVARQDPTPTIALYISALNEMIDVHTERVSVTLGIRIPPTILLGVYVVALLTMFLVGMQSGYNENCNFIALVLLVLILSVVLYVIVDLDRSLQGFLQVPQQALFDLQRQLNP